MEKWRNDIVQKFNRLEEKLEALLAVDHAETNSTPFDPCLDIKWIRTLSRELPEDIDDRTLIFFTRLSLFFEVGVFFQGPPHDLKGALAFMKGQYLQITGQNVVLTGVPFLNPMDLLKTPALPFLKQLKIQDHFEKPEDLSAFLLSPCESVYFVLVTRLVGPWLKLHMDEIHEQVLKAFT